MKTDNKQLMIAALSVLIILQTIMLCALYAGVRPHPPETTPLFGIGPFVGTAIAVAVAAILLRPERGNSVALFMSLLAALLAAVSLGPQKYFDVQFPLIWPAVITGQFAILTIFVVTIRGFRIGKAAIA